MPEAAELDDEITRRLSSRSNQSLKDIVFKKANRDIVIQHRQQDIHLILVHMEQDCPCTPAVRASASIGSREASSALVNLDSIGQHLPKSRCV